MHNGAVGGGGKLEAHGRMWLVVVWLDSMVVVVVVVIVVVVVVSVLAKK